MDWPESSSRFFHNIWQNNSNELFDQCNTINTADSDVTAGMPECIHLTSHLTGSCLRTFTHAVPSLPHQVNSYHLLREIFLDGHNWVSVSCITYHSLSPLLNLTTVAIFIFVLLFNSSLISPWTLISLNYGAGWWDKESSRYFPSNNKLNHI